MKTRAVEAPVPPPPRITGQGRWHCQAEAEAGRHRQEARQTVPAAQWGRTGGAPHCGGGGAGIRMPKHEEPFPRALRIIAVDVGMRLWGVDHSWMTNSGSLVHLRNAVLTPPGWWSADGGPRQAGSPWVHRRACGGVRLWGGEESGSVVSRSGQESRLWELQCPLDWNQPSGHSYGQGGGIGGVKSPQSWRLNGSRAAVSLDRDNDSERWSAK